MYRIGIDVGGTFTDFTLLTEADYAWVTRELVRVAGRHGQGRVVSTLEGGDALSALGRSAAEHIRELLAA